jgi:hypothetical protein
MPLSHSFASSLLRSVHLGLLWDDTHGPTADAYALAESPSPALTTTQRTVLRVAIELFEAGEDGVVEVLRNAS